MGLLTVLKQRIVTYGSKEICALRVSGELWLVHMRTPRY